MQVNGVGGIPAWSTSMSGVAISVQTYGSTAAGAVRVWPSDESMPGVTSAENGVGDIQSNLTIVRPGSDGKIKVNYTGGSGSIMVVLDVQGYFTNTQILPPATGSGLERSGNRPATGMLTRSLTDRVSAGALWTVVYLNQRALSPHVKVSRRLPQPVQRQLVTTLLKAAA